MKIGFSLLRTVCVCMGLIFPVAASAATDIAAGTNYAAATSWTIAGSPYVINGNVTVQSGATLTIDAGVEVVFDADATLTIATDSALVARGELGKEIRFTAPTGSSYTSKIRFFNSVGATYDGGGNYASGSILEYVIVENIGDPAGNTGGAVQVSSSYPFIHNSTFRNNHSPGIGADGVAGGGILKIIGNTFTGQVHGVNGGALAVWGNGGTGSHVILSDNIVRDNITSGNAGGIFVQAVDNLEMLRNVIENNHGVFDGGGAFIGNSHAVIGSNVVRNNKATVGGGLLVSQMSATTIADNIVAGNNASYETGGYRGGMGGGIYVEGGDYTIEGNIVANNSALRHSGGIDLHEMAAGALNATVRNNVIAENAANTAPSAISAWEGTGVIHSNAIVGNRFRAPVYLTNPAFTLRDNTIAQNTHNLGYGADASVILVGSGASGDSILNNNIIGNLTKYDLGWQETDSTKTLTIGSNYWGETNPLTAGRLTSNGGIVELPTTSSFIATNPIAPPTGVTAVVQGESKIQVTWNPVDGSPGYRVYWGTKASPDFEQVQEVVHVGMPGDTQSFEISGLTGGNYYVAVTALKSGYVAANDVASTPVNDNMTRGEESWYGHAPRSSIASSDLAVTVSAYSEAGMRQWGGQIATTDVIHHRIVVTNKGPSDAIDGFSVTDPVPLGMKAVEASLPPACMLMGNNVMCSGLELALGVSVTFDIPLQIVDPGVTTLLVFTNMIEVTPNGADPDLSNNQATLTVRVNTNDLAVSWVSPVTGAKFGTNVKYTIKARNNGRITAQAAALSVALPVDITVVEVPSGCTLATNTVTCPLGAIAPNSEVLSPITVSAPTTGSRTFSAQLSSGEFDVNAVNNVAEATTNFDIVSPDDLGPPPDNLVSAGGGVLDVRWLVLLVAMLVMRRLAVRRGAIITG